MSVLESYIRLGIYFGFFSAFGCLIGASITRLQLNKETEATVWLQLNKEIEARPRLVWLKAMRVNTLGVLFGVTTAWIGGGLLSMATAYIARNIHRVIQ